MIRKLSFKFFKVGFFVGAWLGACLSNIHADTNPECKRMRFSYLKEGIHAALNPNECPLSQKIIQWLHFQKPKSEATFREICRFIRRNPKWPLINLLRQRAEEAVDDKVSEREILLWFEKFPPVTGRGALYYAKALKRAQKPDAAIKVIRQAWRELSCGKSVEQELLKEYGLYLKPSDHIARVDKLIWQGDYQKAKLVLKRVPKSSKVLLETRIALLTKSSNAQSLLKKVPKSQLNQAGLIYARLHWRRLMKLNKEATNLLKSLPQGQKSPELHYPEKWWKERHILIRRALEEKKYKVAYQLASNHALKTLGKDFHQAEWLAGWISLRYLKNPQKALSHFKVSYKAVKNPVSISRAAYWLGRNYQVLKQEKEARIWYKIAAHHLTTFYGQLALAELTPKTSLKRHFEGHMTKVKTSHTLAKSILEGHEATRALLFLYELGLVHESKSFFAHLLPFVKTPADQEYVLSLISTLSPMSSLGVPKDLVIVAKKLSRNGIILKESVYPIIPAKHEKIEQALLLSIMRQESGFDPFAKSSAGALGVMQLMPKTAEHWAKKKGILFKPHKLTRDPYYNMSIGMEYLDFLLERFNGSYLLATAAYNAGESNVDKWIEAYGDPRDPANDPLDWAEKIPFAETREYVQRILESLNIYRYFLKEQAFLALRPDLERGRYDGAI